MANGRISLCGNYYSLVELMMMFVIYRGRSLTLDDSLRKIYFINMLSPSVFTGEKEILLPSEFSKHHLKNNLFKNLKRIFQDGGHLCKFSTSWFEASKYRHREKMSNLLPLPTMVLFIYELENQVELVEVCMKFKFLHPVLWRLSLIITWLARNELGWSANTGCILGSK